MSICGYRDRPREAQTETVTDGDHSIQRASTKLPQNGNANEKSFKIRRGPSHESKHRCVGGSNK